MDEKKEDISIDLGAYTKKIWAWTKKNYLLFVILIPILISIFIRIQTVTLPAMDAAAENNIKSYIQASIEQQVNAQYPNLPAENKQTLVQQQLDAIYAKGSINYQGQEFAIADLVKQNAQQIKENFQDDQGLTYLGEIDPFYFFRLTQNYLDHGYEGDVEINGKYYDTHQLAGTPREYLGGETSRLPHFHVMVEAYFYKLVHLFMPNARPVAVVYFLPVLLATLCVIPAFFMVKKVAGALGGLVAAVIVVVHPAFVGRTIAGFSDTDGYNVLFPLVIMWLFSEAIEAESYKKAGIIAAIAGLVVGIFSYTWGGWWYIYDFLLGVCFIAVWYTLLKKQTAGKGAAEKTKWIAGAVLLAPLFVLWQVFQTIWSARQKEQRDINKETLLLLSVIAIFLITCGIFVSYYLSTAQFFDAVIEPITFSTIKDVGLVKIWPNVLTTVAEFNPASLSEIMGTAGFGLSIILLFAFLGIGYVLFERQQIDKEHEPLIAVSLAWVIVLTLLSSKITSSLWFCLLLLVPIAYCVYKKTNATTIYFVGVAGWYAALIKIIPLFDQSLFLFFFLIGVPLLWAVLSAVYQGKTVDVKYGVLLCIWFIGTIYASTKGVRFVMIMAPAFGVAMGLGVAFVYKLWTDVVAEKIKLRRVYVQGMFIIVVIILLIIPVGVGYNVGYQQMPLINDQWYDALKKIDNEAAPDAIVNSWWDFGHWFKAIANRAVTFDGGSQDTAQAHWIGKVLLTSDEEEAVAILRMLDCGGNSAYDLIYNATNDSYKSVKLTKEIIMQTKEEAVQTLETANLSEEQAQKVVTYTHCNPPEDYFITSQDMVGKAGVWAHFGSWDFDKAFVVNAKDTLSEQDALQKIQEELGISADEAKMLYEEAQANDPNNWIAPWPGYVSMPTDCWQQETVLSCSAGIIVNLTNGDTRMQTSDGAKHPKYLYSITPDGSMMLTDFSNYSDALISPDGRSYSAALIPKGTGFTAFAMDTDLLQSMFTRMFFFNGQGLRCFDLFDQQTTVTGDKVMVWKVDWSCATPNEVYVVQAPNINATTDASKTNTTDETKIVKADDNTSATSSTE